MYQVVIALIIKARNFVVKIIFVDYKYLPIFNKKLRLIRRLYQGKSLIELSITIIILMVLLSSYWFNSLFDNRLKNQNLLKLKKLQQALYFARSEAIRLQKKVYICPTYDKINCCNYWTEKIIIFTTQGHDVILINCLDPIFNDQTLRFKFFGKQGEQKLAFLPNGTTINNGHFCTNHNYCFTCLYMNQAGKSYITTSHNL